MNLKVSNQLNMVGACLTIAQTAEYKAVWNGKPPLDFTADIAALQSSYDAALAKGAQADAAAGGAADAKAAAEIALEESSYLVARALAAHFRKIGAVERLAKVDVARSDIVRLRNQELVTKTTEIRDLALAVADEAGAAGRGVTPERIAALTAAIAAFSTAMSAPRGQAVNRGTLLKELDTDVAALVAQLAALDDLVIQFSGTPAGDRFAEAWRRARIIIDRGGSPSAGEPAKPNGGTPPAAPAANPS